MSAPGPGRVAHRGALSTRVGLAVCIASGLAMSTPSAGAMSADEVYARVSPSVWRVNTYDADGLPLSMGSAVVVAPGRLVTNCHVLRRARRVAVRHGAVNVDAKLTAWDVERDLCQLGADAVTAPPLPLRPTGSAAVGSTVYAIGNPRGLDLTISAGLLSSIRRDDEGRVILLQTSAAISGGSSGGGLFDEEGRLLGLTTLGSSGEGAQNLNFAVPSDWIADLPTRHARRQENKGMASKAAAAASASPPTSTTPVATPAPAAPASVVTAAAVADYARIDDLDRLPFATPALRERYRQFLQRPLPRAFVISDAGSSRQADATTSGDGLPAERAMRDCRQAMTGTCFVYAIDNRVVWQPPAR